MNRNLTDFVDRLSQAPDTCAARFETARFFDARGYPEIALGYTPEARRQAPHLPQRLCSDTLAVMYGNCGRESACAPPDLVKRRFSTSTRPFFWASGARDKHARARCNADNRWIWGERSWALDLGIASGLIVPLRATPAGLPGAFFIMSADDAATFESKMEDDGSVLQLAALAAHERLCDLRKSEMQDSRSLSARETECLLWLSRGLRNDRIAERMRISPATVELHIANARKKLKSSTREQALVKAVMMGAITP